MVDQELLLEAWPKKFLAMPGLSTVDGWMCTGRIETGKEQGGPGTLWQTPVKLDTEGNIRWSAFHADGFDTLFVPDSLQVDAGEGYQGISRWLQARAKGDLLPLVDPRDPAGWACLLRDLADALGWPRDDAALYWLRQHPTADIPPEDAWQLGRTLVSPNPINGHQGGTKTIYVGADTADPAEALVLARIQLREKNGT